MFMQRQAPKKTQTDEERKQSRKTLWVGGALCGTALAEKKTLRVADVHAFPGHIACDSASRAEIVVPVMKDGKVYAVLDVDSPFEDRFTAEDEAFLTKIAALLAGKF